MSHGEHEQGDAHATADHGTADLPREPRERSISPAPEDYRLKFPGAGLLWPFVWIVFGVVLWQGASRWNGEVRADREGPESHEAPAHGD